jgi:hypothetical protein
MNRFRKQRHLIAGRFRRDIRAVTAIEFAVVLPILVFLAFVLFEFVYFQLARVRADKAAYLVAAAVTQLSVREQNAGGGTTYQSIRNNEIEALLRESENLLSESTREGAKVVAASFTYIDQLQPNLLAPPQPYNAPALLWAKARVFDANPSDSASTIAALGSGTAWPSSLRMQRVVFQDADTQSALGSYGGFSCGENVVMVEVFYEYRPLFRLFAEVDLIQAQTFVSRAFLRPRGGDIEAIEDDASFDRPADSYLATKSLGEFCR